MAKTFEYAQAANRATDRESLPRLKAFLDYWREKHSG